MYLLDVIDSVYIISFTIVVLLLILIQLNCKFLDQDLEYCPDLCIFNHYVYVPHVIIAYGFMWLGYITRYLLFGR
jgi:hypothetical protein